MFYDPLIIIFEQSVASQVETWGAHCSSPAASSTFYFSFESRLKMLMNNGPWSPEHIYQEIVGYQTTSRHRGKAFTDVVQLRI